MLNKVIVVTKPELGWDCVVRVADSLEAAARSLGFDSVEDLENDDKYVVSKVDLETL